VEDASGRGRTKVSDDMIEDVEFVRQEDEFVQLTQGTSVVDLAFGTDMIDEWVSIWSNI